METEFTVTDKKQNRWVDVVDRVLTQARAYPAAIETIGKLKKKIQNLEQALRESKNLTEDEFVAAYEQAYPNWNKAHKIDPRFIYRRLQGIGVFKEEK